MAASRLAESGYDATTPRSTSGTTPRSMARPRWARRRCRCRISIRVIGGQHSLLFGPYAGFSSKFLKHGSLLDLFESVRPANIKPLLSVARDNFDLTEYLIEQVLQSESHRLAALDEYFPNAKPEDWKLQVAGQRVQTIKPDVKRGGLLEFGTELVGAADHSLVALLGASPGASTAAFIAISVLEKCFACELTVSAWLPKLKEIIPSYGVSLIEDAELCKRVRAETAQVLKIENIDLPVVAGRSPPKTRKDSRVRA